MRLFKERGITAKGNILPLSEFRWMVDVECPTIDEEKAKDAIKIAEPLLEEEIEFLPVWNYRQFMEKGVIQIHSKGFGGRLTKFFQIGIAEACEKKGRFLEKMLDYMWAILEEPSWVLPEHAGHRPFPNYRTYTPSVVGRKYPHALELGSVYRGASLGVVYVLNKEAIDAISPIIGDRIRYELKERIINPFLNHQYTWSGEFGSTPNNWCPWNVSNVLLVTALFEENLYRREAVVNKALTLLDNFIDGYAPDGGCSEGPGCWGGAGGALFDALETLYDMSGGKISVFDEPLIKAMGEYMPRMNVADNYFVNFADAPSKIGVEPDLLTRYGEKCGSEILASFGRYLTKVGDLNVQRSHPYRLVRALYTPRFKVQPPCPLAAMDTYFPDLKVMVLRETEVSGEGIFFAIKGGHNQESHNHNDVGHFVVFKNGKPVIIDPGVGTYTRDTFGPNRYNIWTMQSKYHNLPMFDGEGERQGSNYRSTDDVYNKEERSLSMQLANAFKPEVGVKSFVRYSKLDGNVITVKDSIELDREREIDFIFMAHKEPKLISDTSVLFTEDTVLEFEPTLTPEIEVVEPVGMDCMAKWGTEKLYRVHLRARAESGEYTFTIR